MGERQGPDDAEAGPSMGIGDLARRTGLTPQAIRAWETRYDFPHPRRAASGRRSYRPEDVDRVARVVALKDAGWRLPQAIAQVSRQDETPDGRDLSVYGALRRQLPHLESRRIRRDALVAISHAIEDEAVARAVRPLVLGTFQRARFFEQSASRWEELARTAEACVVFADFESPPDPDSRPVRCGLPQDSPLLREWVVVVRSADFSSVLSGWEIPGDSADGQRWYETIFSFDPDAVRVAVDTCLAAVGSVEGADGPVLAGLVGATHTPPHTPSVGIDAWVMRAFDYLQATGR